MEQNGTALPHGGAANTLGRGTPETGTLLGPLSNGHSPTPTSAERSPEPDANLSLSTTPMSGDVSNLHFSLREKAICSVAGCWTPARARGWCQAHYMRWYKTGDPLLLRPGRWDGYERPTCAVDGCKVLAHAHGLCASHHKRNERHGDPLAGRRGNATGTPEERFWSFVDVGGPDECWHWNGGPSGNGYAFFPRRVYAHRFSWELANGPIPKGFVVDHRCHNADKSCPGGKCRHRLCVNPAHLEAVTPRVNLARSAQRTNSPVLKELSTPSKRN